MLPLIVAASFSAYTNPVSALAQYGGSLYAGRVDGGVDRLGKDLGLQGALAKPGGARISFISASPYGVAWLSGPGAAVRERAAPGAPAPQKLTIRAGDRAVTVAFQPSAPVRRISWLGRRVPLRCSGGAGGDDNTG